MTKQNGMTEQEVKDEFLKIRDQYKSQSRKRGFNALVYGDFGTGKTRLLHTAPKPVLVHSFDPGGSVTLREWIDKGEVLVDDRFETEDASDPSAYKKWEKEFNRLREMNFFENIGTYCIDSLTTMSESLMNAVMQGNKKNTPRNSQVRTYVPQLQDYQVQQYTIRDFLNIMCGLPCNFICTGHIDRSTDEVTGKVIATPMITGKLAQKIPMLFDEVYVADYKSTSQGAQYFLRTQPSGMYKARSRLAASYDLKPEEEPDISAILEKCNYESPDKNLYLGEKQNEQQT